MTSQPTKDSKMFVIATTNPTFTPKNKEIGFAKGEKYVDLKDALTFNTYEEANANMILEGEFVLPMHLAEKMEA